MTIISNSFKHEKTRIKETKQDRFIMQYATSKHFLYQSS